MLRWLWILTFFGYSNYMYFGSFFLLLNQKISDAQVRFWKILYGICLILKNMPVCPNLSKIYGISGKLAVFQIFVDFFSYTFNNRKSLWLNVFPWKQIDAQALVSCFAVSVQVLLVWVSQSTLTPLALVW